MSNPPGHHTKVHKIQNTIQILFDKRIKFQMRIFRDKSPTIII